MKDQHGHKITEHEFTKDIGHRTEDLLMNTIKDNQELANHKPIFKPETIEEMFDEYAGCFRAVDECLLEGEGCNMCVEDKERMQEIIQEVTKQIQSDLLKEVLDLEIYSGTTTGGRYTSIDLYKGNIKKLAEEKGIII